MATWYSADPHFSHTNILHLGPGRPFATIAQHDEALLEAWNSRVAPGDDVWLLGDVAMKTTAAAAVIGRLNGRVHLVAGNHDACWTSHPDPKRALKAQRLVGQYLDWGFASVHSSGIVTGAQVAGIPVVLSHLPARGDHFEGDRYASRRPRPGPLPLVHGHVHHLWKVRDRQVNVGVDVWGYAPVHEDELAQVLRTL
ncbi:metallophosphoesterase [Pseudactinotalea terrae]|uniref:metallophosphoesterase n=1 Tax=Pseudactinotalea terrae TaxID=1743262 RepID=UPI0012E1413E|nr:metallophosphoesterase [Pseudactinotalea terrae]